MSSKAKRHYTFTNPDQTLEFDSAREAKEYFCMESATFPWSYIGRQWRGWNVTAGEYHNNRFTREAK